MINYKSKIENCEKKLAEVLDELKAMKAELVPEAYAQDNLTRKIEYKFHEITGAPLRFGKSYYRQDLNGFFFGCNVYYNYGYCPLIWYERPGKLTAKHSAFISANANEEEIDKYVKTIINNYISRIQKSFTPHSCMRPVQEYAAMECGLTFKEYVTNPKEFIADIIWEMCLPNETDIAKATAYIEKLLKDGKVINYLPKYLES